MFPGASHVYLCLSVSVTPHSDETTPSHESSLGPIRFYNCDELYYEYVRVLRRRILKRLTHEIRFTNFARASIKHMGARYPTAEHRGLRSPNPSRTGLNLASFSSPQILRRSPRPGRTHSQDAYASRSASRGDSPTTSSKARLVPG